MDGHLTTVVSTTAVAHYSRERHTAGISTGHQCLPKYDGLDYQPLAALAATGNGRAWTALWEKLPPGAEPGGVEEHSGRPIAWSLKTAGGGEVVMLSFKWVHSMREHERMLKALLMRLGCRPVIQGSNPNVWATLWTAGDKRLLFLLNLFTDRQETKVRLTLADGRTIPAGAHAVAPVTVSVVEIP